MLRIRIKHQEKGKIRSFVILLAAIYALIPYDYIIKVIGSMSLTPVLMGIALLMVLMNQRTIRIDKLNAAVLLLAAQYGLCLIWSSGNHISDFISFAMMALLFAFTRSTVLSVRERNFIEWCCMLGSASMLLYVFVAGGGMRFFQSMTGRLLVGNHYSDPNGIAARQFLGMSIAIKKIISSRKAKEQLVSGFCLLCSFVIFAFAASRGAFVGIVICVLFYLLTIFRSRSRGAIKLICIAIVLVLLFSITYEWLPPRIQTKLASLVSFGNVADVSNGRGTLWSIAIVNLLPNMPPWGYGISGSAIQIEQYYGMRQTIHNTYLQYLLELGYAGFFLFVYINFGVAKRIKETQNDLLLPSLVGVLVIVFFLSAFDVKYLWLTLLYSSLEVKQNIE